MNTNVVAAVQSLKESWQRAVLSGSGVAVASIAIILLVSIGLGVEKDVRSQVDDLGVNLLIAIPGQVAMTGGFNPNMAGQSWFKEHHADEIRRIKGVDKVAMLTFAGGGVRFKDKDAFPMVIACTPDWFQVRKVDMLEGRTFGNTDGAADSVVLGQTAKEILFGSNSAIGQSVYINGRVFRVAGVTKEKLAGQSMFSMQGFQNVAYIPFQTMKTMSPNMQIDRIIVKTKPEFEPRSLVKNVESTFAETLDRQQFSVLTQEDLLGLIFKVVGILGTLVIGLTAIGLFVGGVGIMTVMMMAVSERRKEIGVRMATGAQSRDIFMQFMTESALIGLGGVTAGLAFSSVVCVLLAHLTAIKPLLTWSTVALAFAVGLGVGCVFGIWPALRASRLNPVDSLRME